MQTSAATDRAKDIEIQKLRAASNWQPIETAPTDDPAFQALACNYDEFKGCWLYYIINRHDIGGRYECWVIPPGRAVKPTDWMPLPEPPQHGGQ